LFWTNDPFGLPKREQLLSVRKNPPSNLLRISNRFLSNKMISQKIRKVDFPPFPWKRESSRGGSRTAPTPPGAGPVSRSERDWCRAGMTTFYDSIQKAFFIIEFSVFIF
jgi:hypothetical protein